MPASIEDSDARQDGGPRAHSRRDFLGASLTALTATAVGVSAGRTAMAEGAAAGLPTIESDDDLELALPQLSNWGRWGADDQLGTLNFITAASRLRAVGLVKSGRTVSLAREISVTRTPGLRRATYELSRYEDPLPEEAGCLDFIGMIYHGFAVTHIDALCHIFTPEGKQGMYNGYPISDVGPEGAERLGVQVMGEQGIVGRGVLLDIAALKGGPLPPGSAISPQDLEAAERAQGVTVGEGDILFVRNGAGPRNVLALGTGLNASCLPWLHTRRIAVISSDSDGDVHPAPAGFARWSEPVHMVVLPYMGLPILDNTELDRLSEVCREEGRWEFFVTVAPWRFQGATSSPVNPLAMF